MYVILGILAGWLLLFAGGYYLGHGARVDRALAAHELQESLIRCARTHQPPPPSYGRFPVDTGPLFIASEDAATKADLHRSIQQAINETNWLIGQGEQQIPERWR